VLSSRGTGVLDMARPLTRPTAPGPGALAYYVLDAMISMDEAITSAAYVEVESTIKVPALLPVDWDPKAATLVIEIDAAVAGGGFGTLAVVPRDLGDQGSVQPSA
jgi:hypothetical protein